VPATDLAITLPGPVLRWVTAAGLVHLVEQSQDGRDWEELAVGLEGDTTWPLEPVHPAQFFRLLTATATKP
jgi:hypothetical protein